MFDHLEVPDPKMDEAGDDRRGIREASETTAPTTAITKSMAAIKPTATATPHLPEELILKILEQACLDPDPCFPELMDRDYECSRSPCLLSHFGPGTMAPRPLDQNLLSVFQHLREEAYQTYYRHNTFEFHQVGGSDIMCPQYPVGDGWLHWEDLRDPRATRLLEFIDQPDWRNRGSIYVRRTHPVYDHCDRYRHLISRIVTMVRAISFRRGRLDCEWPLLIDWRALPNLEYLVLDLYEFKLRCNESPSWEHAQVHYDKLLAGAQRMASLELKELVVFGLLNLLPWWKGPRLKEMIEELFRPAMAPGGEIRISDSLGIEW